MKRVFIFIILLFIPFCIDAKELKMEWQKSWGTTETESLVSVLQTSDEKYIIVGRTTSYNDYRSFNDLIFKLDNNRNILWQKRTVQNERGELYSSVEANDGNLLFCGWQTVDYVPQGLFVKYNKDGELLWKKLWGGNRNDEFYSFSKLNDNKYVVVGSYASNDIDEMPLFGSSDALIVVYDDEGNIILQKRWGGNDQDAFNFVVSTRDGGFVVVGETRSTDLDNITLAGGIGDALIVKYDKDGNIEWQKNWGGNGDDIFNSIVATNDAFIVVGKTSSDDIDQFENNESTNAVIIKYDLNGNVIWQKSWGGEEPDLFNSIKLSKAGNYIVTGYTASSFDYFQNNGSVDAIILEYDRDGNLLVQNSFGGSGGDIFNDVIEIDDGLLIVGLTDSKDIVGIENNGSNDMLLVKYSYKYNLEENTNKNGISVIEQQGKYGIVKPTPNEGFEVDKIIVKDKDGNILDVEVTKLEDGTYSFPLYSDVSVEVLFKEILSNPKTGVFDYISFVMVGMLVCLIGYITISYNNQKFEL